MAQQPAVVIIARHGPRLDVADRNWHLTTPTPYDPPLTYGGWNHSRALGLRIAGLLYAREQSLSHDATTVEPPTPEGVKSHDFGATTRQQEHNSNSVGKKRKRMKHRIVIHSSPFLRCIQTSVGIAAGISQFAVPAASRSVSAPSSSRGGRSPNYFASRSPRSSSSDHTPMSNLLSIPEPRQHNTLLGGAPRHKRVKMRVDAFLGEWLNADYFEDITPPPPSAMMVATAKAELMQNDSIDIFTPTITHKSSKSSLWGGTSTGGTRPQSRDSALEDWDDISDALPAPLPSPRRDRTYSHSSSIASNDSAGSRTHAYRLSQPQSSFLRTETTAYAPPVPTYAISTSDRIPKGYVAHAKNNCTDIDFQWDSSRPPHDWGDGGEYGEEWSLMQRRFRRGLTEMMHWYSRHDADERGEDALGFEQAEDNSDDECDEQEELVVVIVTHGAGCNALIGALTGQPVLLDVGTASLTMGIRKDDAPPALEYVGGEGGRKGSVDLALTNSYDLKIVASTEHLRPGFDPLRMLSPTGMAAVDQMSRLRPVRGDSLPTMSSDLPVSKSSISSALGSIRRPHSSSQVPNVTSAPGAVPPAARETVSIPEPASSTPSPFTGLWTPPSARTPQMQAKYMRDDRREVFSSINDGMNIKPPIPSATVATAPHVSFADQEDAKGKKDASATNLRGSVVDETMARLRDKLSDRPPQSLARGLSQKALWGAMPSESHPIRSSLAKRRWTMQQEQ